MSNERGYTISQTTQMLAHFFSTVKNVGGIAAPVARVGGQLGPVFSVHVLCYTSLFPWSKDVQLGWCLCTAHG